MSRSSAAARRKRFRDRISENHRNSDDSTSLKHPFLGMAASYDTVKFANESSEHFSVVHTPGTTRSLWFWLIAVGVYPLSTLVNSALQWVPAGKIDNDLNWYGILCFGLSGVSLFGYLLLTPRWIECDFQEQTLTYRVGGLRGCVFGIRFRDIKNVTVGEYVVVSRGGTRHDVPVSQETLLPVLGKKYTVNISLQSGESTYPFVTSNQAVASEFVSRLTRGLTEPGPDFHD